MDRPAAGDRASPQELQARARTLHLGLRGRVRTRLIGAFASAFRGDGTDLAEVREYRDGDDVRSIDWNVTARSGRHHVREFEAERRRRVLLVVDRTVPFDPARGRAVEELAAVMGLVALDAGDRVGAVICDAGGAFELPPRSGPRARHRLFQALESAPVPGRSTFGEAVRASQSARERSSLVLVFSDFTEAGLEEVAPKLSRPQTLLLRADPWDWLDRLDGELVRVCDVRSGRELELDLHDSGQRAQLEQAREDERVRFEALARAGRCDAGTLPTDARRWPALIEWLALQARRVR